MEILSPKNVDQVTTAALLVANPGRLRNSTIVLLNSIHSIEMIGTAGGGLSAAKIILEEHPGLVILDGNLAEDEALEILRWIQAKHPYLTVICLEEEMRKRELFSNAGADFVLSRGLIMEQLVETLDKLNKGRMRENESV